MGHAACHTGRRGAARRRRAHVRYGAFLFHVVFVEPDVHFLAHYPSCTFLSLFNHRHRHHAAAKCWGVSHYKLGIWVDTQRQEYRKPNHGRLSKDRIAALESLDGWMWAVAKVAHATAWQASIELLKKFRNAHGHCRVRQQHGRGKGACPLEMCDGADHKSLGIWVNTQRTQYNKPSHGRLNEERIQALESIDGWQWIVGPERGSRTV